jgi:hypothetical protein
MGLENKIKIESKDFAIEMDKRRVVGRIHDTINVLAQDYCMLFARSNNGEENDFWDLVDFCKHCEDGLNSFQDIDNIEKIK